MGKSMKHYEDLLKNSPTGELTVASLGDFFNAILAINKFYKKVLFRGQADKLWKIESSAYRALKSPTQNILKEYHLNLIREVNNLHDTYDTNKYSGISLLAHLQHNGAKTCLIDYTINPLVSLWFACISEEKEDGCIYCIRNSVDDMSPVDGNKEIKTLFEESNQIYVFYPPNINRRIIAQQSVFLISASGVIEKGKHITIKVYKRYKKDMLSQLSLIGVSRRTLFPDFNGLVEWFSFEEGQGKEVYDYTVKRAEECYSNYRLNEAINLLNDAISLGKNLFEDDSVELSITYNNIARVYYRQGEYSKALEWYRKALDIKEKILGKGHPETAATYNNIALVYYRQGEYLRALEWYQKALDIREKVLGTEHPDTATTYNNIARVYYRQGGYLKALEWYHKALDIREKVLGTEHPDTAATYNNIALVYYCQGEYTDALELYQRALDIREKVLGTEHFETAATYNNIALVYENQGEYTDALELYQRALDIREKILGKEHPDTAATYNNIALVYYRQGEYLRALEWYHKTLDIREKVLGIEHPDTAITYNNIANVYYIQGEYSKALELYQKALDIRGKVLGIEHPDTKIIIKRIEQIRKHK